MLIMGRVSIIDLMVAISLVRVIDIDKQIKCYLDINLKNSDVEEIN